MDGCLYVAELPFLGTGIFIVIVAKDWLLVDLKVCLNYPDLLAFWVKVGVKIF